MRLGILGSTRGTNLVAIHEAIVEKKLAATVDIVLSNKPDAYILERAASFKIPAQYLNPQGLSREEYDALLSKELKKHRVDLVVLIGYFRILSASFVNEWRHKIINVHPSLLPAFAGKMDLEIHRAVLAAGVKETGCTVHEVTEEVDGGPIIVQKSCQVLPNDTPDILKSRVQALEGVAMVEAIATFTEAK